MVSNVQDLALAALLNEAGFSTELDNVHIHATEGHIFDFSDCQFNHVTFSGDFQTPYFVNVTMNDSVFHETNLNQAHFVDAHLNNVSFDHVKVSEGFFSNTHIRQADFVEADFSYSAFVYSDINGSKAWNSNFSYVYFGESALENSIFAKSDFHEFKNDSNQFNNVHVIFTQPYQQLGGDFVSEHWVKPTIVTVGDPDWHNVPSEVSMNYGAIVDTIPEYINDYGFNAQLTAEVKVALNQIDYSNVKENSIAHQILYSDQPTIKSIKEKGWHYVENADAILLPGGPDVHPEFYGEDNISSYVPSGYYREILEFSLIDAAIAMDKPIFGICHGSQIVNVYLGGTLHQHVPGQSGIQPFLDIHTHEGILGSVLEDTVQAPSYHHQAVKDVAPSLEVVASYNGVIKATQANDDKKIMLTQFHPEYEIDQSSKNIISTFLELSAESVTKNEFIAWSDVLEVKSYASSPLNVQPPLMAPPLSEIMHVEDPVAVFG